MVKIVLTMQRVQSLVRELISHMLCGSAKKWEKKKSGKKREINVFLTRKEILTHAPAQRGPPGSSVHGISQARIMEWVAISFSRVSS